MNTPADQGQTSSANDPYIDLVDGGSGETTPQHFSSSLAEQFPAGPLGISQSFVVQATADVYIPAAATWTFGTNSDDGAQLMVGGNTVLDDNQPNTPTDTLGTYTFASAGEYPLDLLYFQDTGGASVELYAAPGNWTSFSSAVPFQLVGDTADGGLSVTNIGSPSGYTVAAIAGDNLYIVNSNPGIATGNYTGVTVASANFTPEITVSKLGSLTLNVSGPGDSITGAIASVFLSAQTSNGNITLFDSSAAAAYNLVDLATIDAGTAQIDLVALGPIINGSPVATATRVAAGDFNLVAGAVDLTTTGTNSTIGAPTPGTSASVAADVVLATDIGELTATTNDGGVAIDNAGSALTINSVVADQDGQAPVVNDDQVVYNSTPTSFTPTYVAGSSNVSITSAGPIVLNSISATGSVTVSGEYIVEGDAQAQGIVAQSLDLTATGAANYQGQLTFATSASGDTLTLPVNENWTSFGFSSGAAMTGTPLVVSGASQTANDGSFTIQSISGNTLILNQSYVLDPETEGDVTVGNGMIGLESPPDSTSTASYPIDLAETDDFTAATANGNIYLSLGGSVDSAAVSITAGGSGNVGITSSGNFLTIENITATGFAPTGSNSSVGGDVFLSMSSGALLEYPQSNGNAGIITAQGISLASALSIGSPSSPFLTDAFNALMLSATATSPSEAAVYVDNLSNLASVQAGTDDGTVLINYLYESTSNGQSFNYTYAGQLSFENNELSKLGSAVVTFANTDDNNGSAGNVELDGSINASSITAGGQILVEPNSTAEIYGQTVTLSAGNGIGTPSSSIDTNATALDTTTSTGSVYVDNQTAAAPQAAAVAIGSTAAARPETDNASGQVYIYTGGSLPAGTTVSMLSIYANQTGWVTPVLFQQNSTGKYTVAGIGDSFDITTTGPQSIPFNLLAGSAVASNGSYTFGFINASVNSSGAQTASTAGVVAYDSSVDSGAGVGGGTSTNGWEYTPNVSGLAVGINATYGTGGTYTLNSGRTYSATLTGTAPAVVPAANWSVTTGSLSSGSAYGTATLLDNGEVLYAGGYNGSSFLSTAELYNPTTETWSATGSLNIARVDALGDPAAQRQRPCRRRFQQRGLCLPDRSLQCLDRPLVHYRQPGQPRPGHGDAPE